MTSLFTRMALLSVLLSAAVAPSSAQDGVVYIEVPSCETRESLCTTEEEKRRWAKKRAEQEAAQKRAELRRAHERAEEQRKLAEAKAKLGGLSDSDAKWITQKKDKLANMASGPWQLPKPSGIKDPRPSAERNSSLDRRRALNSDGSSTQPEKKQCDGGTSPQTQILDSGYMRDQAEAIAYVGRLKPYPCHGGGAGSMGDMKCVNAAGKWNCSRIFTCEVPICHGKPASGSRQ